MLDVARSALWAKSSEEAQGYRLRVDTLKWRASKMKPRSYGDKATHLEAEVNVRQMTDEQFNARLAYLLGHRPGAASGRPPRVDLPRYRTSCSSSIFPSSSPPKPACPFNGHVPSGLAQGV